MSMFGFASDWSIFQLWNFPLRLRVKHDRETALKTRSWLTRFSHQRENQSLHPSSIVDHVFHFLSFLLAHSTCDFSAADLVVTLRGISMSTKSLSLADCEFSRQTFQLDSYSESIFMQVFICNTLNGIGSTGYFVQFVKAVLRITKYLNFFSNFIDHLAVPINVRLKLNTKNLSIDWI